MGCVTAAVIELFRVAHRNGRSGASKPYTRERPTLDQFLQFRKLDRPVV